MTSTEDTYEILSEFSELCTLLNFGETTSFKSQTNFDLSRIPDGRKLIFLHERKGGLRQRVTHFT